MTNLFRRPRTLPALLLLSVFALSLGALAPQPALAAPPHQVTTHASKSRGAAPAVKLSREDINKNPKVRAGGKSRSGILHINNHTQYYIDIYVDGVYAGDVSPYGDLYFNDLDDVSTLYGEAPGTTLTWGPGSLAIPGVWNLY